MEVGCDMVESGWLQPRIRLRPAGSVYLLDPGVQYFRPASPSLSNDEHVVFARDSRALSCRCDFFLKGAMHRSISAEPGPREPIRTDFIPLAFSTLGRGFVPYANYHDNALSPRCLRT